MNTEPIELEPATAEPPGIDTALPLPACSAFDAALARIVCDARLAAWLARFPGLSDWRASAGERPCFERPGVLELRRGGAAAHVAIDLAAFPALEVVAAPALDARGDASLSLRAALAATLLAPLVAAFAAAGLDGVTVGALRAVPAAALDATRCMLSFALDGAPLRCALLDAQAPWLDALAARLRDERRRDASSGLARVRLPGRVRLGTRALPLAVLRSLRPGDVLLDMVPAALGAARAARCMRGGRAARGPMARNRSDRGNHDDDDRNARHRRRPRRADRRGRLAGRFLGRFSGRFPGCSSG